MGAQLHGDVVAAMSGGVSGRMVRRGRSLDAILLIESIQ